MEAGSTRISMSEWLNAGNREEAIPSQKGRQVDVTLEIGQTSNHLRRLAFRNGSPFWSSLKSVGTPTYSYSSNLSTNSIKSGDHVFSAMPHIPQL
jgi:hypothetical protein